MLAMIEIFKTKHIHFHNIKEFVWVIICFNITIYYIYRAQFLILHKKSRNNVQMFLRTIKLFSRTTCWRPLFYIKGKILFLQRNVE